MTADDEMYHIICYGPSWPDGAEWSPRDDIGQERACRPPRDAGGIMMPEWCCNYSLLAHGTRRRSGCPRGRWQALVNRLGHAGWLDRPRLIWHWARGYRL